MSGVRVTIESPSQLESINDTFGSLLSAGRYEQQEHPLDEELGAWPEMTRLVFAFNRRLAGRLRKLINTINDMEEQPVERG